MKKQKSMFSQKSKDNLFVLSFMIYPLILFAVFYVGVNFNSILMSFKYYDFSGVSTWVGFKNFATFFKNLTGANERWTTGLINSLKMYIISLIVCLPLYILFSYILFKKCFMHGILRGLVMIPQIISGFIMCLVFKKFVEGALPEFFMVYLGRDYFPNLLTNPSTAFGTTLFYTIWVSFSTSLIVYPNAMNEIDDSIFEASYLDGVSNIFQELKYIILPLIFPTISTFLITGFAGILSSAGSIPTFFMYSAPLETVNIGYIYWSDVAFATTYNGFPVLAAGGLIMTFLVAPLTILIRWVLDKFDPSSDM